MTYQFDFSTLIPYFGLLLHGIGVTLGLAAASSVLGMALGTVGAALSLYGRLWTRRLIATYVELIRNTPFIVQMFFVFFGLPSMGVRLSAMTAALLAMTINLTAYAIEIIRAGLEAVPRGQTEAARGLGLRSLPLFCLIVLPQALAHVWPALTGQITITMLESAVVSQIAVVDLTHVGDLIQSRNFRSFETYFVITLIYLALAMAVRSLLGFSGRRLLYAGRHR